MTTKEMKIQKRNELLKMFNPLAINIDSIRGLGTTFNFRKKTVTLTEQGHSYQYDIKNTTIENQSISYIIR